MFGNALYWDVIRIAVMSGSLTMKKKKVGEGWKWPLTTVTRKKEKRV